MNKPVVINGRSLPLLIRKNARSTRMSLRVNASGDGLVVVAPPHVPERTLRDFVVDKADWISAQLQRMPGRVRFVPGAVVPVEGAPHEIRLIPRDGKGIRLENGFILAPDDAANVAPRLTVWLKARARDRIALRANAHAATLGVTFQSLSLKDTRSRWGSCSSNGRLSFSWRLILAPEPILDYVTAHEVAHLVEFNHSSKFWALVESLVRDTRGARQWLRANGAALHAYG